MGSARAYCSTVVLPGDREVLALGGLCQGEAADTEAAVLDLGTIVFTTGSAMAARRYGCAAWRLSRLSSVAHLETPTFS